MRGETCSAGRDCGLVGAGRRRGIWSGPCGPWRTFSSIRWRSSPAPRTSPSQAGSSPLDPVIHDRERTRRIFDFDYKWEVYDKPEKRKFGYYTFPILWGDRIVARMDAALDRISRTLVIKGLWFEDEGLARSGATRDPGRKALDS